jgi:hypothetical protein
VWRGKEERWRVKKRRKKEVRECGEAEEEEKSGGGEGERRGGGPLQVHVIRHIQEGTPTGRRTHIIPGDDGDDDGDSCGDSVTTV